METNWSMNRIRHSTTHPRYLSSNSTSHRWAFGAIAELVDNSVDASATVFLIDVEESKNINDKDSQRKLIFQDNGTGMAPVDLHRMLSFGHCNKEQMEVDQNRPFIGHYGNGFKSGSMRIGKDAIVFSKNGTSKCIGLLSQTFLEKIHADEILVPIVGYASQDSDECGRLPLAKCVPILNFVTNSSEGSQEAHQVHEQNVQAILEHSPFNSLEELDNQFNYITRTGTRVVIWNLAPSKSNPKRGELSFIDTKMSKSCGVISMDPDVLDEELKKYSSKDADAEDGAEAPEIPNGNSPQQNGGENPQSNEAEPTRTIRDIVLISELESLWQDEDIPQLKRKEQLKKVEPHKYSLHAYLSILYLEPTMQIWLRGQRVHTVRITSELCDPITYQYHPRVMEGSSVPITYGFYGRHMTSYGALMYHKNRLIVAFQRLDPNVLSSKGKCVVGVIEANFLKPTHNKQDFVNDSTFSLLMLKMKNLLYQFFLVRVPNANITRMLRELEDTRDLGPFWVQCSNVTCRKWRKIKQHPASLTDDVCQRTICLTNQWTCSLNLKKQYASCEAPQESLKCCLTDPQSDDEEEQNEQNEESQTEKEKSKTNRPRKKRSLSQDPPEDGARPKRKTRTPSRYASELTESNTEALSETPEEDTPRPSRQRPTAVSPVASPPKAGRPTKPKSTRRSPTEECQSCNLWTSKFQTIVSKLLPNHPDFVGVSIPEEVAAVNCFILGLTLKESFCELALDELEYRKEEWGTLLQKMYHRCKRLEEDNNNLKKRQQELEKELKKHKT